MRRFLNDHFAVPLVAFFKSYVLNYWVGRIPSHRFRQFYYRRVMGIKIGRDTSLALGCQFFGDRISEMEIGNHVSIPPGAFFVCGAKIAIGDHVMFGHRVSLYTSDHDPDDPAFARRNAPIVIEERAFVASQAIILPGVTIGRGAVVAAGAVVTRDVPPFSIVAGVPARVIRERRAREFTYRQAGPLPFFY